MFRSLWRVVGLRVAYSYFLLSVQSLDFFGFLIYPSRSEAGPEACFLDPLEDTEISSSEMVDKPANSSMNWIMREKSASLPFAMAAVYICWAAAVAGMDTDKS